LAQNTNASAVPLVLPVAPTLDIGKIVTTAVDAVAGAVTSTTAAVVGVLGYLVSPGTSNVCTCSTDQPQVGTPASTSQQGAVNNGPIESRSNPLTGKPGDTTTLRNPDGTVRQVRGYGPDGYPKTDVDHGHDHGAGDPHSHDWGRPANGGPPTHVDRGPGRPVQPGDPQPN